MSDTDDPPSDEEVIDLCDSDPDSDSGTMQALRSASRSSLASWLSASNLGGGPGDSQPCNPRSREHGIMRGQTSGQPLVELRTVSMQASSSVNSQCTRQLRERPQASWLTSSATLRTVLQMLPWKCQIWRSLMRSPCLPACGRRSPSNRQVGLHRRRSLLLMRATLGRGSRMQSPQPGTQAARVQLQMTARSPRSALSA